MRIVLVAVMSGLTIFPSCSSKNNPDSSDQPFRNDTSTIQSDEEIAIVSLPKQITADDIVLVKEFLYDKYTLEDTYPYKDTTRTFQWDKIKKGLALVETIQMEPAAWGVLQNYKNLKGEAPLVKVFSRNDYKLIVDSLGTARYQGVPLYLENDTITPALYALDGSLIKVIDSLGTFLKAAIIYPEGIWYIPKKYTKLIGVDTLYFSRVVFVDRTNQHTATMEKSDSLWLVRSMNPVTTGKRRPPYGHQTPLGIFVVQEKRSKMVYLKDGSTEVGGFAPYASRFCSGAYIHGVPVAEPGTAIIEYSSSLGTTPRSHMCVRNASSHAEFVYNWAKAYQSLVFVIE